MHDGHASMPEPLGWGVGSAIARAIVRRFARGSLSFERDRKTYGFALEDSALGPDRSDRGLVVLRHRIARAATTR
jgi:hypothetical protein